MKEFEDSTPLLSDVNALRARAKEHGYLFFRSLLQPDKLLTLRKQILEVYDRDGLLDKRMDLMEGIADMDTVERFVAQSIEAGEEPLIQFYMRVQHLQCFHEMSHDPALLHVFEQLFGETVFPHPRNIARIAIPHSQSAPTPPHQDFVHIQGTEHTWTCWFPLTDVPRELGGLAVLEKSHKEGLLHVTAAQGAGNLESILCDLDLQWATVDYQMGDVLILHSYTVHRALPNMQNNKIRLSCDFRYQPASREIEGRSLLPHAFCGWDDIYQGWTNEEVQYYWKKYDLSMSEWDEKVRWQKEKIC